MRNIKTILCTLILLQFFNVKAGNGNLPVGARSAGLAHASVTLVDAWSAHHNQGALGFLETPSVSCYYENRFFTKALNLQSIAGAYPLSTGALGFTFQNFGNNLYSESKIGVGYGLKLADFISAGVQISYLNSRLAQNYGMNHTVSAEFGILAKVNDNLSFGAHVFNPFSAKLADYADERVPSIIRLGMQYNISKKVTCIVEAQKDIEHDLALKLAIEYQPNDIFYIRGGASTGPINTSFGFGAELSSFRFDLAASWHYNLGFSPQVGLTYQFNKNSKEASSK